MWVSLKRGCENLGLDVESQRKKLKGKPWAVAVQNTVTGPDGKQYAMTCIDLDTLPGWLFSIDARKVKEELREKLARYQREAAKVFGRATLTVPVVSSSRTQRLTCTANLGESHCAR